MKMKRILARILSVSLIMILAFGSELQKGLVEVYADTQEIVDVPIDVAYFPDESFRAYIGENCDKDGNGTLSAAEIEETTEIYVAEKGINSLKGIEYFTELEKLKMKKARIEVRKQ